jgi:hypothetical protein
MKGNRSLALVDQNKDVNPIPRAPKKPKARMKNSKRKKIFGSIYSKNKPVAESSIKMNNIAGSTSSQKFEGSLEPKIKQEKKRSFSRISRMRKQKKIESQSKRQRAVATETALAESTTKARSELINDRDYMKNPQMSKNKQSSQIGFVGLTMPTHNSYVVKQETPTEVSALTMSSPQAVLRRIHARDRQNRIIVPTQKIQEMHGPTAKSQSDSYTRPGSIIFNKSASNAYTQDFYCSSSSCSSDSDDGIGGFNLEVEPIVVAASSLSSQSSDCTSSEESSEGSCSVSTSASHLYENCQEKPESQHQQKPESGATRSEAPTYKRVLSGVQGVLSSYSGEVKSVLSSCFAPALDSPPKKSCENWSAFCRSNK